MSVWEIATWIAIAVLIGGSLAVFAWFLTHLVRLNRATRESPAPPRRVGQAAAASSAG